MSTTSLLTKAAKPGQATPQEVPEASAAMPEPLIRTRLAKKLAAYDDAVSALGDAKAHLSRSEVDEQKTLDDENLSDSESMDAVAFAQKSRGVYAARVASREVTVKKLLVELEDAVRAGHAELRTLVMDELKRREAILVDRVCDVIKIVDRARVNFDWVEVLDFSEPFRTIRNLEPSPFQTFPGSTADYVVATGRRILEGYQTIETESRKAI